MNTAPERQELPFAKATFKELRAFAADDMGITIENGWNSARIKVALKESGWEHEFILGPAIDVRPRRPRPLRQHPHPRPPPCRRMPRKTPLRWTTTKSRR
jgi:hypothetical protein